MGTPRLPAYWHGKLGKPSSLLVDSSLSDHVVLPDLTIAHLDQRGYDYEEIVAKLRRIAPKSIRQISPIMVERRLLALDQVVEIDYWRVGSQADSQ